MNSTPLWILLLSSAAVGALVSAALTTFAQWQERKARQRLIFSKSVEMANTETDRILEMVKLAGSGGIYPTIVTARWYHRQLTRLFREGKIADDLEAEFNDYINKPHKELK
jgi:hypothetical protein